MYIDEILGLSAIIISIFFYWIFFIFNYEKKRFMQKKMVHFRNTNRFVRLYDYLNDYDAYK